MQLNESAGILLTNEPLAQYTSWRIGGPAKNYYRPKNQKDLAIFLAKLPKDEPLLWLGLGSNVLIHDDGFAGTVIHTLKMESQISQIDELSISVDAGVPCAKIAKFAAKHNLAGGEFFAGIPGTMGGALHMNAGAFGGETWSHVTQVTTVNRQGEIQTRKPKDYKVGYRHAHGPSDEWFLSAQLKFKTATVADSAGVKELLARRNSSQPIGLPSCGSVFRNPEGKYAAELIEASKLKGIRVGGAEVSTKHANFIINTGNATAKDVAELIAKIREQVLADHSVTLQPEVQFIGF